MECILEKITSKSTSNTTKMHKHIPMSYCFYVIAKDGVPVELIEKFHIPQTPIIYRENSQCSENSVTKRIVEE